MVIIRKKTREVHIRNLAIGNGNPILIQSMCNTKTSDAKSTIKQIQSLESIGCDIVRVSVPDKESADALKEIRKATSIPIVADIHFDYKLALLSIPHVDKLRINPGNIGDIKNVKILASECEKNNIPIRIGVNSGSIDKEIEEKYGRTPEGLVASAKKHVKLLEDCDFHNIVISLKASSVNETIDTYRLASKEFDYPLHVGVTEAGTTFAGTIKSSIGIGTLLHEGIGDTIRVSLTADPEDEIRVGHEILKSLDLKQGRKIVSCPTCARTEIDIINLAEKIEKETEHIKDPITIAVMGCVVNGPGEAKHADYGIAGGKKCAVLFKKGEIIKKVDEENIVKEFLEMIENDT